MISYVFCCLISGSVINCKVSESVESDLQAHPIVSFSNRVLSVPVSTRLCFMLIVDQNFLESGKDEFDISPKIGFCYILEVDS